MAIEVEIKLKIRDRQALAAKLTELGSARQAAAGDGRVLPRKAPRFCRAGRGSASAGDGRSGDRGEDGAVEFQGAEAG